MTARIVTSHVLPAIPIRNHDWMAYVDGMEEDGPYGWGETEEQAVADLNQMLADDLCDVEPWT